MLQQIQLYITRRARPYQNALTDETLVQKEKQRYYKQIRLTLSTKETNLRQNVDIMPNINQEIISLMKPHLTQIVDHCDIKCRFVSRTVFKFCSVFSLRLTNAHQQCLIKMLILQSLCLQCFVPAALCTIDPG